MDFELFNNVSSSSDLDMSGLISSMEASTSEPIMLSLDDEHLLSSLDDEGKSLSLSSSSNRSSNNCFYFIPDMTTTCSLVNPGKDDNIGVTNKLFLKDQENGMWVLADKEDEVLEVRSEDLPPLFDNECFISSVKSPLTASQHVEPQIPYNKVTEQRPAFLPPASSSYRRPKPFEQQNTITQVYNKPKVEMVDQQSSILRPNGGTTFGQGCHSLRMLPRRNNRVKKAAKKVATKYKTTQVAQKFLKTLVNTVTQQLSSVVRKEVQNVMEGLQTYLDAKLPQPKAPSKSVEEMVSSRHDVDENSKHTQTDAVISDMNNDHSISVVECTKSKIEPFDLDVNCENTPEKPTEASCAVVEDRSKVKGIFEQQHISTVNTLLKYVTSTTLVEVETVKKPTEIQDTEAETSYADDALNLSTNIMESDPIGYNDAFSFPKLSLGSIKNEPVSFMEDESSSPGYLEFFSLRSNQFLELKPNTSPTSRVSATEPCKALTLYAPPSSPTSKTLGSRSGRTKGGELVPKPEMPLTGIKNKKPLICEICDRTFLNNSSLKQHLSFHQPQRPYQCDQTGCTKSYKTRSELNRHLIVHSGEKKYGCIKCGKTFLRKQYLKTHLIRHNEGLTRQCPQCAKIFVSEEDLNRHKISYHKNGKRPSLKMIKPPQKLALTYHFDDSLEA